MGMDLTVYRLLKALPPDAQESAGQCIRTLYLTPVQQALVQALLPGAILSTESYLDIDKLREAVGFGAEWNLSNWDFSQETGWAELVAGERTQLVEVVTAKVLVEDPRKHCTVEVEELGYIRKPFRHYDMPSYTDGDNLVLSIDNFTGVDMGALNELFGPEGEDGVVNFFYEDLHRVKALAQHCYDPRHWERIVLQAMTAPDCVTVIDW